MVATEPSIDVSHFSEDISGDRSSTLWTIGLTITLDPLFKVSIAAIVRAEARSAK